ncbi:uncharacterized protein V6R79_000008 [Siganus canaliculatus]
MDPSVLLLLVSLLTSSHALPPPRTSFHLNSADRPLVVFSLPDVHNVTTLLLSNDGSTLYAGARDALLSLDVSGSDVITLKRKVSWRPSDQDIKSCEQKGKEPTVDCPNFVSVLQPLNSTHLYACGSYAYSPHDAFIDTDSFSLASQGGAKGRCPFSPWQRNTAVAIDGELFTATTTDFRGVKPQISRHFSKDGRYDVSQDASVRLLDEPTFVGSALDPADRKLYFFFTEVGKEFSYVDELRIARVAQVCKDDVGGQRTLQRKWTSFAKATLLCRSHKQLPFSILQDVFTLQPPEGSTSADTLFYGVFTSQWSTGPESAVCVFRLQDVKTAFSRSYRTFDMKTHQWSPMLEKHPYLGQCGLETSSDSELAEVKRSFLTSDSVMPEGEAPIFMSSGQRYSRVAAMRTKAASGKQYTVLFLLTDSGFLHKLVLLDQGARVTEEIQVFSEPQLVRSIVLSAAKGFLYLGTSGGVVAVPVARCSIYSSCSQCVLARDPLCGWSRTRSVCSSLDGGHDDIAQDLENGDLEKECQGQTETSVDSDVGVRLNEVVKLPCGTPSNLASLSWTSPRFAALPLDLFIQSADGSLSFLATAHTLGTYRCEAREGRHQEVVRSYNVHQVASPRAISPGLRAEGCQGTQDESIEEVLTEEPETVTDPPDEAEAPTVAVRGETFRPRAEDGTEPVKGLSQDQSPDCGSTPVGRTRPEPEPEPEPEPRTVERSYYSELLVVSFLLAACCCLLVAGAVHARRTSAPKASPADSPDNSRTVQSTESVSCLSDPKDPEDPEVLVVG